MSRREDRARRRALDHGDPDDIVLIKLGHSGTQCADSYHTLRCPGSPVAPEDVPNDANIYELREMFDWGKMRPKKRGFVLRSTKQPAACHFYNSESNALVCPKCGAERKHIDRLTNHYHAEHRGISVDGPTEFKEMKRNVPPTCGFGKRQGVL